MRASKLVLLTVAVTAAACATTPKPPSPSTPTGQPVDIDTTEGVVRGLHVDDVSVFKGVPYAAPLDGILKWRPPQSPPTRDTVLDATRFGDMCFQAVSTLPSWMLTEGGAAFLDEMAGAQLMVEHPKGADCLNLNIWTPLADKRAELPVLVMLHGGGLSIGSALPKSIDGTSLAQLGAVVVTIHYRLGATGFLTGDDLFEGDVLDGNRGMMDTVAALRWLKKNVRNFGGDPDNITLAGQSGGGTNVWAVLASPSSKGLVRRAIVHSGPINMVSKDDQQKLTRDVLKSWNVEPGDAQGLANLSDDQVSDAIMQTTLLGDADYGEMSRTKLPTTGAYGTDFMPQDVLVAIENGALDGIDLMVGSAAHDGRASVIALPLPNGWAIDLMNGLVAGQLGPTEERRASMFELYRAAVDDDVPDWQVKEKLQTDGLYRVRALRAAELHAARGGRSFVFQFNWQSPLNDGELGAMHGLDLIFAMRNTQHFPRSIGSGPTVKPLADEMSQLWVSFMRSGQPESSQGAQWPPYDAKHRRTMVFDESSRVAEDPDGHFRELWSWLWSREGS